MAHNMNSYSTLTEALENEYRTDELKQLAALGFTLARMR